MDRYKKCSFRYWKIRYLNSKEIKMSVLLTYIFILDGVDVRNEIEIGTNAIGKYVTDPYHLHIRQL